MKPSELDILISVESYDEKTNGNYRDCYVVEKCIFSKLSKISIPNFNSTNWRLELTWIWRLYLLYFPRNRPSKSVTIGQGRFIVLNDSASPKRVVKIHFNFFRLFFKKLYSCLNVVEATYVWLLIGTSLTCNYVLKLLKTELLAEFWLLFSIKNIINYEFRYTTDYTRELKLQEFMNSFMLNIYWQIIIDLRSKCMYSQW